MGRYRQEKALLFQVRADIQGRMAWVPIIMDVFMPSDRVSNIGDVSEWGVTARKKHCFFR